MPDTFTNTTVTNKGWGSRLGSSLKGILFGLILFFGSFVLLYWNEGRVDVSKFAVDAIEIESVAVDSFADGELVAASGPLTIEGQLQDEYLQPGDYVLLRRNVEMYAWVEESESESDTNLGGSETTTTTYTYEKQWVSSVPDSSDFKEKTGHENPPKAIDDKDYRVKSGKIGVYKITDMNKVALPGTEAIALTEENAIVPLDFELIEETYLYNGFDYTDPDVGDLRISYEVLEPNDSALIFGQLKGDSIGPYFGKKDLSLYRIFYNSTKESAVEQMHSEYTMISWILRVVGFLMMFIGLSMLLAPLKVLMDVIPIFGKVTGGVIGLISFLVALVLSIITIIISMILHSVIALVVVLVIAAGITFYIFQKRKNKPAVTTEKEIEEEKIRDKKH